MSPRAQRQSWAQDGSPACCVRSACLVHLPAPNSKILPAWPGARQAPRRSRRCLTYPGPLVSEEHPDTSLSRHLPSPLRTASQDGTWPPLQSQPQGRVSPPRDHQDTARRPTFLSGAICRLCPLAPSTQPHPAQTPPSSQGRGKNKMITTWPSGNLGFTACPALQRGVGGGIHNPVCSRGGGANAGGRWQGRAGWPDRKQVQAGGWGLGALRGAASGGGMDPSPRAGRCSPGGGSHRVSQGAICLLRPQTAVEGAPLPPKGLGCSGSLMRHLQPPLRSQ